MAVTAPIVFWVGFAIFLSLWRLKKAAPKAAPKEGAGLYLWADHLKPWRIATLQPDGEDDACAPAWPAFLESYVSIDRLVGQLLSEGNGGTDPDAAEVLKGLSILVVHSMNGQRFLRDDCDVRRQPLPMEDVARLREAIAGRLEKLRGIAAAPANETVQRIKDDIEVLVLYGMGLRPAAAH